MAIESVGSGGGNDSPSRGSIVDNKGMSFAPDSGQALGSRLCHERKDTRPVWHDDLAALTAGRRYLAGLDDAWQVQPAGLHQAQQRGRPQRPSVTSAPW